MKLEHLLVFQVNHLGDMVAMLPCLNGLRKMLPQARITLMTSPAGEELVRYSGLVDEVISMPFAKYRRLWRSPTDILSLTLKLRRKKFSASLSANDECSTSAMLAWMAGIGLRIGFQSRAKADLLYSVRLRFAPHKHVIENRYRLLDVLKSESHTECAVPPMERVGLSFSDEEERLYESQYRSALGPCFVAVHPFSKLTFRTWPEERFGAFIHEFLKSHPDYRCALLTDGKAFRFDGNRDRVVELHRTTLRELAWIIREANAFVGNNSGPFHLACALGTPAIALTGPTQRYWWPMPFPDAKVINLHAGLQCSPCEVPGHTLQCPKDPMLSECLERITAGQLLEAAHSMIRISPGNVSELPQKHNPYSPSLRGLND